MNELDEVWTNLMNEAIARAKFTGRHDVADYLTLKAANDLLRTASVRWLFDAAAEIAAEANRRNAGIDIENVHPHKFKMSHANPVGSLVRFRQGVRCMTVEAGWTRTPNDGFMRGGALAVGRIEHFGMTRQNSDLILLKNENAPCWFAIDRHENRAIFDSNHLQRHFRIFLDAA